MNKDQKEIIEIMSITWNVDGHNIPHDVKFNEYIHWDSWGHINLLVALEDKYGLEIDYDSLSKLTSIDSIIEHIFS